MNLKYTQLKVVARYGAIAAIVIAVSAMTVSDAFAQRGRGGGGARGGGGGGRAGGGGYGVAFERDPEAVREDVIDRYVSREYARSAYGVELTDLLDVDLDATRQLRSIQQT